VDFEDWFTVQTKAKIFRAFFDGFFVVSVTLESLPLFQRKFEQKTIELKTSLLYSLCNRAKCDLRLHKSAENFVKIFSNLLFCQKPTLSGCNQRGDFDGIYK